MIFHNPWAFAGLGAIPVIILMYLLKRNYNEVKIPALFLWEKAYANSIAHKPWQKLNKNLLLFLQLLIAIILVLALSDPSFLNGTESAHYILILDQSMSMQAEDIEPNRFEYAKKEMKQFIDDTEEGATLTVIIMGKHPFILVNQVNDKYLASKRMDGVQVSNAATDVAGTQSLIAAIYNQTPGNIVLFSDQAIEFEDIPVAWKRIQGENPKNNIAITLLTHRKEEDRMIALVKCKNYGAIPSQSSVILYGDENVIDIKKMDLDPGEEKQVFFTNVNKDIKILKAQLKEGDVLERDNVALDVVTESPMTKVLLISEQNIYLERVFSLLPQTELFKTKLDNGEEIEGYDLYVFDGMIPDKIPEDGHILIVNPPKGAGQLLSVGEEVEIEQMYLRESQLLEGIQQMNFAIQKTKYLETPEWAEEILGSEQTPLILAGEQKNQKIGIIGFDLHHTDLPLKKEFPILIHNLYTWFIPQEGNRVTEVKAGNEIILDIQPAAQKVQIIQPNGMRSQLAPPFPALPFSQTEQIGIYLLEQTIQGEKTYQSFAVNPPVEIESDLWRESTYMTDDEDHVVHERVLDQSRWHLNKLLILLVLCGLILEWWVFSHVY